MSSARPESLTDRTLGGLSNLFVGVGLQTMMQLIVLSVLARLLSPAEFGLMGAATVVVAFVSILSQSGIGPAIVQRAELDTRHLRVGLALSIGLGFAACIALILVAPWVAMFFRMPELESIARAVSIVFPIAGVSVVTEALLQRELRFRQLTLIAVLSYAIGYGAVGIILALAGYGVWALVGAQLGQAIVRSSLLLSNRRAMLGPPMWAKAEARHLLRFGFGLSLAKFSNQFALQGDNLIVGRLMGAEPLGAYGRAYQAAALPAGVFGSIVDTVLFPVLASVQNERTRLARGFIQALSANATITLPVSSLLIVLAPELIVVLFGSQWAAVVTPFRVLSFALLCRTSYKLCDTLARATGAVYRQVWRHSLYAAAVTIGAWDGHYWGLSGVATGVVLAILFHYLMMVQLSLQLSGATWGDVVRAHIAPLLSALALGTLAQLAAEVARRHGIPPLVILFGIGGAAASAYLLLLRYQPRLLGRGAVWLADLLAARCRSYRDRVSAAAK